MSKIVIKEFDNTTAAAPQYTSFSVVIPGFVKNTTAELEFDENGIREFNSQKEFKDVIGFSSAGETKQKAAVACRLTEAASVEEWQVIGTDYFTIPADTVLYTRVKVVNGDIDFGKFTAGGYLRPSYTEGTAAENQFKYGHVLADGTFRFEPYFVSDGHGLHSADEALYFVDDSKTETPDTLGSDAVDEVVGHFGNQMAYELLGLGYTVLYKKLDTTTYYSKTDGSVKSSSGDDTVSGVEVMNYTWFWEPLKDKAAYDFRYLTTGLLNNNKDANIRISEIASYLNGTSTSPISDEDNGRGDIIALLDVPSSVYNINDTQSKIIAAIINYVNTDCDSEKINQYSAIFAPGVTYSFVRDSEYDSEGAYGKNRHFPAAFHYLACAANASAHYAEWYAVAGYTRGISPFTVASTDVKLGDAASNLLQRRNYSDPDKDATRAVNIIAKIRNQYILWGNRTANKLRVVESKNDDLIASDFLNIRQLCCTLKKQIYTACRQLTYDPNNNILFINFKSKIRPILEKMKNDQGIKDYEINKVEIKQRALLSVNIRIVPIEAVEDFEIGINLEDSLEGIEIVEG